MITDASIATRMELFVQTKSEAVYVEVRRLILEGVLEPGATLSQEALASSLGISVTPLREALRRLEADRLVELRAHRTMAIPPLTRLDLNELYALHSQLDPLAAGIAAKTLTIEQLGSIAATKSARNAHNVHAGLVANRKFHRAIYAAAGNGVLTEILDGLWNRSDRYRFIMLREHAPQAAAAREHAAIVVALRSRDARQASRLMDAHVRGTLRMVEDLGILR